MVDVCVSSFLPSCLFLLFLWAPPVQSYPDGGRIVCTNATNCTAEQAVRSGGFIFILLDFNGTLSKGQGVTVEVSGRLNDRCQPVCSPEHGTSSKMLLAPIGQKSHWIVNDPETQTICKQLSTTPSPGPPSTAKPTDVPDNVNGSNGTPNGNSSATEQHRRRRGAPTQADDDPNWDTENNTALYRVDQDGLYSVSVTIEAGSEPMELNSISITLKNPYGYLDAADYPAMVFYSIMLVVYVSLAVVWGVLLCCSYKDLIRLQFFIAVAILLGVLEKSFFVAEYAVVNVRGEPSMGYFQYLIFAEGVSALKKTFARVLLIIVSLGYGTVIPRLGAMLKWVILFGVLYFAAAYTEGAARAYYLVTREGFNNIVLGAFIPQLVMEVVFIYWIINAIVNTRRTLRLRRNIKKLAFYNHLLYTFTFAVIGITAFCLWVYISGFIHSRCEDLMSLWLKECFWHIIFTVLLVVIMVLWRPSSNALRYAYSLVHDADEEEVEQKVNKNLETMSKRQRAKGDEVAPPKPSHDMEEDLKWVEENLPTSTIDQVLQPLVDSDEDELMTSRFELSKMD